MQENIPLVIAVLSAATALVSVIVGPFIAIRIAKSQIETTMVVAQKQIRADVVSSNRQAWINTLRDCIADFLSAVQMAHLYSVLGHADKESLPRIENALRLKRKLSLLINPNEADHARLDKLADEAFNGIKDIDEDIDKRNEAIIALSQEILKREWVRVKDGE